MDETDALARDDGRSLLTVGTARTRISFGLWGRAAKTLTLASLPIAYLSWPLLILVVFVGTASKVAAVVLMIVLLIAALIGARHYYRRRIQRVEVDESGVRFYRGERVAYRTFDELGGSMISEHRTPGTLTWVIWRHGGDVEMAMPLKSSAEIRLAQVATSAFVERKRAVSDEHMETRRRLQRGATPVSQWLARLKQSSKPGVYRSTAWDLSALLALVCEPAYPPEERAGAAVVLLSSGGEADLREAVHEGTAYTVKAWLHQVDPEGGWLAWTRREPTRR